MFPIELCCVNIDKKSGKTKFYRFIAYIKIPYKTYLKAACAAASLAMGTRKGEQLT